MIDVGVFLFVLVALCFGFVCFLAVLCCMQDLNSQPEIELVPPALGAQNLRHSATREVLFHFFFFLNIELYELCVCFRC